ncbi:MAG: PASTA domain-containing protein [Planctomycetota bacterium]|jgi:hypothetical protein
MADIDYDLLSRVAEESGVPARQANTNPLIRQQAQVVQQEQEAADPMRFFDSGPTQFPLGANPAAEQRFENAFNDQYHDQKFKTVDDYVDWIVNLNDGGAGPVFNPQTEAIARKFGQQFRNREVTADMESRMRRQQQQREQQATIQNIIGYNKMLEAAGLNMEFDGQKLVQKKDPKPKDTVKDSGRIVTFAKNIAFMAPQQQKERIRAEVQRGQLSMDDVVQLMQTLKSPAFRESLKIRDTSRGK